MKNIHLVFGSLIIKPPTTGGFHRQLPWLTFRKAFKESLNQFRSIFNFTAFHWMPLAIQNTVMRTSFAKINADGYHSDVSSFGFSPNPRFYSGQRRTQLFHFNSASVTRRESHPRQTVRNPATYLIPSSPTLNDQLR